MSKFIRHLPCPRCKSRDNYGEYSDHYYCFGCKYTKPKDDIGSIRQRLTQKPEGSKNLNDELVFADEIPTIPLRWLVKYGITFKEMEDFNIKWEPFKEVLVLIKGKDFYQGRCFGNHKMKYFSKGSKQLTYYGYGGKLVCVEDVLSAIKVARLSPEYCAVPLLGCSLPADWIQDISGKFEEVVIWLDRDKAKDAVKIARDLRQRGFKSRAVISPDDPKEYSKGELSEWLKRGS